MCTLSFVPSDGGFLLVMNRDEQRTRAKALHPELHRCGSLKALYPTEPGGGTWIGINSLGLCAALINWYSRPQYPGDPALSRGVIIPRLLACASQREAELTLRSLPLQRLNPFRLFVIGGDHFGVREHRSDGKAFECINHPWAIGHWFSSGHNEASATESRRAVVRQATGNPDRGTLEWLVRLHSSHEPEVGANSICMHRNDAVTVSMTILNVSGEMISMSYHDGAPCESTVQVPPASGSQSPGNPIRLTMTSPPMP